MAMITVREYQRAVRFDDGRLSQVLTAGRHRYRRGRTEFVIVDLRAEQLVVAGQEMLTADGVAVRLTVVVRMAVTDPVVHVTTSQRPADEVYAAAQQALRAAVAELELAALLDARATLGSRLLPELQAAGERVGVGVSEVVLRDVMLPGDLRRAYAQTVLAREQGRAELERARAEAATLRSLANTARLLEEHPALLRLRTLQVAEREGAQVRLTMSE